MKTTFATHDLYLASALKLSGFRLLDLKKDHNGKGLFIFEDRPDRAKYVRDYFGGDLTGSLKGFASVWADLKALVNEIDMEKKNGREIL